MTRTQKIDDWIVLMVADFVLITRRYKLIMTTRKKEDLETVLQHYRETLPKRKFFMRAYSIKVLKRKNKKVLEWVKVPGYSMWEKI